MHKDPNEGARLLRLAIERRRLTHESVQNLIGGGSVSRYLSGERLPQRLHAIALREQFKIPVDAWDLPVAPKASTRHRKAPARQDVQHSRKIVITGAS